MKVLDTLNDPCPKLTALGHGGVTAAVGSHVVGPGERLWTGADGIARGRCRYCSRTIALSTPEPELEDLEPATCTANQYNGLTCRRPATGFRVVVPAGNGQVEIVEPSCSRHADQLELELPEARSCATCGGSLEGRRPQATTCSSRCRQAAARRRQPAPARELRSCRYCRRELTSSRASTCSSRCRSAMFRQRSSAVLASDRTHLDAGQLYRLRLAKGPDAPAAMRVAGSSFWACRCGLIAREADATCGFCGGARPAAAAAL